MTASCNPTVDVARVNRKAVAAICVHALDAADARLLLDMCGLLNPDGTIRPDDDRIYDVREIEAK